MLQPQPNKSQAKVMDAKMASSVGVRGPTQAALVLLAIAASFFWSYRIMMNERMATFELQANLKQLQTEVREQQDRFDGHDHGLLQLQATFETLQTNFQMLRNAVREQRTFLDTQQLELAQLQTQQWPSQKDGILSAAEMTQNEAFKQPSTMQRPVSAPLSEFDQAPFFKETITTSKARPSQRKLSQQTTDDRAMIRVDAPEGFSQFIMGAESAVDNVIMEKQHLDDGGEFTLSRNETQALGIDVDGGVTIHSDPLKVASTVQAISGNRLTMRSTETIHMQTVMTHTIAEIDGQGKWSSAALTINVGDTVKWTWTNYHNVIETDEAGVIKGGGQTSGTPAIASSFELAFNEPGTYRFKSQTYLTMTCNITVVDSFKFEEGSLTLQSLTVEQDVEVNGQVIRKGFAAAHEIKLFLGSECPPGWVEATELGGYMLMGRSAGGEVNRTTNRPMSSTEEGRTHGVYYKGGNRFYFGAGTPYSSSAPSGYRAPYAFQTNGGPSSYNNWFDRLSNPAYQSSSYMEHIGTILCRKRVHALLNSECPPGWMKTAELVG